MKRISLAVFAVGIIAAVAYAAPDTEPWRSVYEQRQHKVPQRFDKEVQIAFVDAGVGSKVGARRIATAQALDGGLATPLCEFGHITLANGDAGIVFAPAFTSIPACTFSRVGATNGSAVVNISTAPTTTVVGIGAQSAGTDVVNFICCGDQ